MSADVRCDRCGHYGSWHAPRGDCWTRDPHACDCPGYEPYSPIPHRTRFPPAARP